MVDNQNSVFHITKSLSKPIYEYLKKAIVNNDIKANATINEKEIAENFGVSRTPVREAIIRLSMQGFVDIHYHRDSVVRDIPYEELQEILHVISCLDAYAITIVADKIRDKDIAKIENLTSKLERYLDVKNAQKFFVTNFTLHEIIWDYLPEGFLRSTLEVGVAQIQRYTIIPQMTEEQIKKVQESSFAAHKKIVTALKDRDKEKLSSLFRRHWIDPGKDFLS
jgi:DNA-binding GntR family transcriptional regulator